MQFDEGSQLKGWSYSIGGVFLDNLDKVVNILKQSKHSTVFTGAGISVESGIPPFRGENGLWEKYDPYFLQINYFLNNPKKS